MLLCTAAFRLSVCTLGVSLLVGVSGCAAPAPRSTSLTSDDLVVTASELAAKLTSSDWLRQRSEDSPRAVVVVSRVQNLSNDLLSQGEQWYVITRVRDSLPIADLRRSKALAFVIPSDRVAVGTLSNNPQGYTGRSDATHEMTATFRSARRAAGLHATEGYDCEFRITALDTGEVVFADSVAFKRVAVGKSYD